MSDAPIALVRITFQDLFNPQQHWMNDNQPLLALLLIVTFFNRLLYCMNNNDPAFSPLLRGIHVS